jgi:hypothetical protein
MFVFLTSLAAVGLAAAAGWPGAPNHCLLQGDCYCETPRSGPIAQPANTWSLLPFSIAGLAIAWHAGRTRQAGSFIAPNRMVRSPFYAAIYSAILVFMGPGGAAFHASLTDWGGAVDVLSMFLWINFLVLYDLGSIYNWSRRRFLVSYVVATAILMLPRLLYGPAGVPVFAVVFVLWVVIEAGAVIRNRVKRSSTLTRDHRWLFAYLTISLVAFAIWIASHAGGLLCKPESLLQGHAAWHVLNAVAFTLLYPYLRSEGSLGDQERARGVRGENSLGHRSPAR